MPSPSTGPTPVAAIRSDRALEVAPSVDVMFQAVSYEELIRAVEPMSLWEIGGTVARNLRRLGTPS